MFEVGFTELLVISVLALIVLGPERLPKVVSEVGRWMGRARAMARQFREQLEEEVTIVDLNAPPKPAASATAPTPAPAATAAAATAATAVPGEYADPDLQHNDYPGSAHTPVDDPAGAYADPYATAPGPASGAVAEAAVDATPPTSGAAGEPDPIAPGDDGHEQRRA